MDKATEAQVKEFWEWCGIRRNVYNDSWANGYPCYDSLDDLFKYAVPKVKWYQLNSWGSNHHAFIHKEGCNWVGTSSEDPALALFWALWQVKEK